MKESTHAKFQWDSKNISLIQKKSHSANLIGLSLHSQNTFLTSSQDKTIRLWDIRSLSSIKLIRNPLLTPELSNPSTNGLNSVYIGSQKSVIQFDLRQDKIFIQDPTSSSAEQHLDNINQLVYNFKTNELLSCDDEGDVRVYETKDSLLKCINKLEQEHLNICNSVKPVFSQKKQYENKRLCVSGGYDCKIILWDIAEQKPIKKIPVGEILEKYQIKSQNQNYPFIHSISTIDSNILVGLQTGTILCLPIHDLRKAKFILQASLTRIKDCKVVKILNKNMLLTCSIDDSFSIFDYEQRVDGHPKFVQKYKTNDCPTQIQFLKNHILVITETNCMGFYQLKI